MHNNKLWLAPVAAGAVMVLGLSLAPSASAVVGGPVSATPSNVMPQLATSGTDGTVEQVRQLVPCGSQMYAVGTFTSIKRTASNVTTTYTRNNAFSFDATTGVVSAWDPNVNGTVNTVGVSADCATAYLGGKFSTVGGQSATNLAAVNTSTGALITTFRHAASGQVEALLVYGPHLLTGGYFTAVNGNLSAHKYMASLNTSTGSDDGYVNLNISGNYVYTDLGGRTAKPNATRVYNYSLSRDGTNRLLVMGDFTSVGGVGRRQMFMLDLGATSASVDPWYSTEFDKNCATVEPFWLQDASWAPDGSKVYIATTGYKPATGTGYVTTNPRTELCDAAAAFPSTPGLTNVAHSWVNYAGCDSLFSTAADASTVYIGGHERWSSNPNGCDRLGLGGIVAPGMAGLSPINGALTFNPTRGRGLGADDMVLTPAGLWIASDNAQNTDSCAGQRNHMGICFLPY